ncbi:MAG: Rrf2 family transcriptional regulator [Phycisphaerae bacterium]|nr:Rrf2 family transcriptional regulator [Phycisphaerae bacterium]
MLLTQKCLYAVRAIFEIAARFPRGPVKIADIARAQAIPQRFLEAILTQLKQAGLVESRRGKQGGYLLARSPATVTIGDIIRVIEGDIGPVECLSSGSDNPPCALYGQCAFSELWERARDSMSQVYDGTTFQHLLEREREKAARYVPVYSI